MFVRRTGTHRAHTDIAEVATRRVRRLGGLDPPPADRRRAPAADRPGGGGVRQPQARMVAAVHEPPRGGWVPVRPEPPVRPPSPEQQGPEQQGPERQGPEQQRGRAQRRAPERPQGPERQQGPERRKGSGSPALGRDSPAPSQEQVASTEVTVQELRALAAARDKRDKIAERLPVRLGLTGGHVAIIALVLVVAIVAASTLVWRSRPVASAVSGPVSPAGSTAAARPPVDDPGPAAATGPAAGGSDDAAAGGSDDAAAGGSAAASQASGTSATGSTPATSPAMVIVHVAGKVARPGVVTVPGGARVEDAIEAAGGALPGVDLRTVNLARQVGDGEQVLVGFPPEEGAPPAGTGTAGGSAGGAPGETSETEAGDGQPIDLNTATLEQLETLPGVGPVLAQRLLDYRAEHGGFAAVDELLDVSGIGEVTFAELEPLVTVG